MLLCRKLRPGLLKGLFVVQRPAGQPGPQAGARLAPQALALPLRQGGRGRHAGGNVGQVGAHDGPMSPSLGCLGLVDRL
eukprot:scaffold298320_cov32-Prasinocladus_malaysianus.AAC.1